MISKMTTNNSRYSFYGCGIQRSLLLLLSLSLFIAGITATAFDWKNHPQVPTTPRASAAISRVEAVSSNEQQHNEEDVSQLQITIPVVIAIACTTNSTSGVDDELFGSIKNGLLVSRVLADTYNIIHIGIDPSKNDYYDMDHKNTNSTKDNKSVGVSYLRNVSYVGPPTTSSLTSSSFPTTTYVRRVNHDNTQDDNSRGDRHSTPPCVGCQSKVRWYGQLYCSNNNHCNHNYNHLLLQCNENHQASAEEDSTTSMNETLHEWETLFVQELQQNNDDIHNFNSIQTCAIRMKRQCNIRRNENTGMQAII